MKILHCCLACFYIDNYSYQENILPRYHKKMGHDVRIVASTETFDAKGNTTYINAGEYINEDGITVTRLPYVSWMPSTIAHKLRRYVGLKNVLENFSPDFIFIHDVQFLDIDIIYRYAKDKKIKIVADCHADFSNSARNFLSRYILHGCIYKRCAKKIEPITSRFYGVLPARVDFLTNVYKIPKEKVSLLVMGSEDEKATSATDVENIRKKREEIGVSANEFLIVTGGKIDLAKTQVLLLMDAVNELSIKNIKLVVFGSVVSELEEEIQKRLSDRVQYIGWLNADESYNIFGASDLVCFPGRHSVYWEQVAGIGKPMVVKYWEGTTHVDCGGNVRFLYEDSKDEIKEVLSDILNEDVYNKMSKAAIDSKKIFMYGDIARRCL